MAVVAFYYIFACRTAKNMSLRRKMRKAPEIENLITRFKSMVFTSKEPIHEEQGFNIYADFQDDQQREIIINGFGSIMKRAEFCVTCYSGAKYNLPP